MAAPVILAVLLLAVSDAATVALDPKADLAAALKSPDALTRATAGRVAMVRGDAALVPVLREALASEKVALAAREEMRAIVLFGSDEDIAFVASQLRRFPASIDGDFGEAIGRLGAPRATTLYLRHVAKSRDPVPAMKLALWGRTELVTATAERLLAAGDARGSAALQSEAAKAVDHPEPAPFKPPRPGALPSRTVKKSPVSLPILLPDGLAQAIFKETQCRDPWIGLAKVSVDGAGRVKALDLSTITTGRGCAQALETMLRLSLAEPETIASPRENVPVVVVKPFGRTACFDEDPVREAVWPRGPRTVGGRVKPPEAIRFVQPAVPVDVRRDIGKGRSVVLVAEAYITRTGCVRELRLVKASEWPSLNSAALLAIAEWTFKPATLDFAPVDAVFSQTIDFVVD